MKIREHLACTRLVPRFGVALDGLSVTILPKHMAVMVICVV